MIDVCVLPNRLIYDPATGKPRGFGFCEYEDPQTAMSAVRNLAGRELNGRPLRIDSATNAPGGEGPKGPPPPIGPGAGGPIEVRNQSVTYVMSYSYTSYCVMASLHLASGPWSPRPP